MKERRVDPADLPHLTEPVLQKLMRYWMRLRGSAPVPRYRDFDVLEARQAMACLWVCDYLPDEDDPTFVYRLAGEEVNQAYERSIRGRRLDEIIPPKSYPIVLKRFETVVRTPAISVTVGRIYLHLDRLMLGQRVILPFADDDGTVNRIMGATWVTETWDYVPPDDAKKQYETVMTPVVFNAERPAAWREGFLGERSG